MFETIINRCEKKYWSVCIADYFSFPDGDNFGMFIVYTICFPQFYYNAACPPFWMLLSESAALFCENGKFVMDKLDCVEVYKRYFF